MLLLLSLLCALPEKLVNELPVELQLRAFCPAPPAPPPPPRVLPPDEI